MLSMKRSGSDYWKKYHDDFWDDPDVLRMTPAQAGVYDFLLGIQAKHGKLPVDPRSIAALCARFPNFIRWYWPVLEKHFPIAHREECEAAATGLRCACDLGRRNPRQAREVDAIDARRGDDAAKKRLERANKAGCPKDIPPPEKRREEEIREEETRQDMPPAEASANKSRSPKRQKPKTERAPATGPEAEIIQAFEAAFLAKRKATYAFEGGKDGSAVKRLLAFAGGDPRAVIDRIPLLFADEWYGPKATLSMFVMAWNKLPVHKLKAVATPTFDEFEYTRKRLAQEEERRRLASGGGA